MCDSRLSPMGWLSFSACPLPKCPIERGKDNRPTLGGTMSVLALSLGLSTVLILTALHIASYTHIHARGHTHILTTIHNCIRRSSCKGDSCHKCHELQLPKEPTPNHQTLTFQNSMPVSPLRNCTRGPMRIDSILRYTTLPKFKNHTLIRLGVSSCSLHMTDSSLMA